MAPNLILVQRPATYGAGVRRTPRVLTASLRSVFKMSQNAINRGSPPATSLSRIGAKYTIFLSDKSVIACQRLLIWKVLRKESNSHPLCGHQHRQ